MQFAKGSFSRSNRVHFVVGLIYGVNLFGQINRLGYISSLPTVINVIKHIRTVNLSRVCSSIYLVGCGTQELLTRDCRFCNVRKLVVSL